MTNEKNEEGRGMLLIEAIELKAVERGMDFSEFTEALGFTESYYRVFRRGERWIGMVGHSKLEKIAEFLEVPLASVYVLAGILKPTDFVQRTTLTAKIKETFLRIRNDPVVGPFAPTEAEWDASPESVRYLTILLFERYRNEELLDLGRQQSGPLDPGQ